MLGGRARDIIFSGHFDLFSAQTTLFEVPKHLPWVARRLHKSETDLFRQFQLLPVVACQPATYEHLAERASELIGPRDPLDIALLALALARGYRIWSDDRDFEDLPGVAVMKTSELLALLGLAS
jgi:predicted nucleic acid-binding protein